MVCFYVVIYVCFGLLVQKHPLQMFIRYVFHESLVLNGFGQVSCFVLNGDTRTECIESCRFTGEHPSGAGTCCCSGVAVHPRSETFLSGTGRGESKKQVDTTVLLYTWSDRKHEDVEHQPSQPVLLHL